MKDENKTKKQLINELLELRKKNAELERSDINYKQAEETLKKLEEKYHSLIENAIDAIVIVNKDSTITAFNKKAEEIFGYSRKEVLGKSITMLTHPIERERQRKFLEKLKKSNKLDEINKPLEGKILRKDGQEIPVETATFTIKIPGGYLIYAFVRDITGRKLAEEEIRETRDFLDNIIESSLDCIMVSDNTGCIARVNKYFLKLFGYSEEEVVGKHIMEITPMNKEGSYESTTGELIQLGKEYTDNAHAVVSKFLEEGKVTNWENYYFNKDRKLIPVEQNIVCLYNKEGERTGAVAIVRDITERKKIDKEIRESRDFLQNIFNTSLDGIIVTDSQGCIVRVNRAIEQMLGFREDELIGKYTSELGVQSEESIKASEVMLEELFEKGFVNTFEAAWYRKDRSLCPVEMSITFIKDKEGTISGSVGAIRDITERRKAEQEIRESRDFLESVIEGSRDGIVISDEKGYIVSANIAMEKMCKFRKEELVGKHTSELTIDDKDLRKEILEKMREFFERGYVFCESKHETKDGNIIAVEYNLSMIKDDKGDYIAGVSIIRDVTERKKAIEALKKSEHKYHSLVEHANSAIVSTNIEGIVRGFNKKAEEIYGYSRDEIMGKPVFLLIPQNSRDRHKARLENFKKNKKLGAMRKRAEGERIRKNGEVFPVEVSAYCIEIDGEYILTAFVQDISDRKKMEQQLLQSEKLKSLGELAGGVAHDFNNVLAAILGRAQLLKMAVEPPAGEQERRKSVIELKEGLDVIERASRDGAETVRRIQEFARRRDEDKHFTIVDLNEIIDNALDFTRTRWKNDAESKGIKINIKKEFSTLPTTSGSAAELREVFTNLINNALDAMPQGGQIRIKTYKEDSHIVVNVADTGIGIADDRKDRIFDPFFTTKGVESSGLGMSVSYGIINRHRGTIRVDSTEGQGTTFTIKLPIIKNAVEEEKVKPISGEIKKAQILVIEDEEGVRNLLSAILKKGGHEVETATSGDQGIEIYEKNDFDLVFTDLGMPGMSGWQVAEKVKSMNGRVPVVLITGWDIRQEESGMKDSYVDLIIQKPFEVEQVLNLVQEGMILRDRFKAT